MRVESVVRSHGERHEVIDQACRALTGAQDGAAALEQAGQPVTAILVLSRGPLAREASDALSDRELERLCTNMAETWESATSSRAIPALWIWNPLVEHGVINEEAVVAILEVDLLDNPASCARLREMLRTSLAEPLGAGKLKVNIVWASQMIRFRTEKLDIGGSVSEVRHGYEEGEQGGHG